ncbi:TIGR02186 family protein [Paracoccus ravus]|uniref:TIGR02186 family protein n=1 Tax=Paracoccus ravus TaxID=2447760 RepID=UPI00106DD606|nr:TIGR02186 family protein [Paracoccus ravus]
MIGRALILLFALASPLGAQENLAQESGAQETGAARSGEQIVADMSRDDVDITTSFDGSDIIIYGAIKREMPIPETDPLDVIVTVEGPPRPVTVRHKERRFGIWVNTGKVGVAAAPNFYVVATSRPLGRILDSAEDSRYRISVPLAMRAFSGASEVEDVVPYTAALVRLREAQDLYRLDDGAVRLAEQTLFRADIRLPANLMEGLYATRIFLLRDGKVLDTFRAPIEVRKVGLERWLYRLALDQPFLYGLMSLALAVFAGWAASAAFRRFQSR